MPFNTIVIPNTRVVIIAVSHLYVGYLDLIGLCRFLTEYDGFELVIVNILHHRHEQ
jgi:hypothetical protein